MTDKEFDRILENPEPGWTSYHLGGLIQQKVSSGSHYYWHGGGNIVEHLFVQKGDSDSIGTMARSGRPSYVFIVNGDEVVNAW